MIESSPPSARPQRDLRDQEHLRGAERRAHDDAEPRRLARAGAQVVDVAGSAVIRDSAGIVVRTDVVPTRVFAAQSSAANCAFVQRGVAFGLPTSPGGRLIVRSRTCSGAAVRREAERDVTSGCEPACSEVGVTVNERTSNAAWAEAGRARRSATTRRNRLNLGPILPEDLAQCAAYLADRAVVLERGAQRRQQVVGPARGLAQLVEAAVGELLVAARP